jgi:hypothetical protein
MSRFHWVLLLLYLTAAAAYGGWSGRDLWSGWGVWCLLLPPLAWAALKTVGDWRRNPYWVFVKIGLVMTVFSVVVMGGQALLLAWMVAEATARWSAMPAVRAIAGVGLGAAVGALALAAKRAGHRTERRDTNGLVRTDDCAEPDDASPLPD